MNISDLSQFHFLRPLLLWLVVPTALVCWALAHTALSSGRLQKIIDPELLPHLLLRGGDKRPWLFALIFALLASMIFALAGPSWRKFPTPVYSNQDALVILLDLSPSMMATDLTPDRLTRARLKILDILNQRKDGLTALVAYAGEAYVVTPLTDDTATIANLVPALTPGIMPVPGSNIEMAVETGLQLLIDGASGRGKLLAVTDGIDSSAFNTVENLMANSEAQLSVLAIGSGEGSPIPKGNGSGFITDDSGAIIIANFNSGELRQLADNSGGKFAKISVDDSDITGLLPEKDSPEQAALTEREFDQWQEEGPWLVLILLPFALLLFRRGALACALPLLFPTALLLSPKSQAFEWQQLWQREDQRAEQLLEQGEAKQAAELFENPQWRGTANYRAKEYETAAKNFSQSEAPQALYNLGNSLTQQGRYDEALKAYDQALQQQPEFTDAEHNREITKQLKKLKQQQQQSQNQQNDQQQDGEQDSEKQNSEQQQQSENNQQSQDQQQGEQNQSGSDQQDQQQSQQQDSQQDQQRSDQQNAEEETDEQQQQADKSEQDEQQSEQQKQQQKANAEESPLDPETQQALDQWLRQIPDDPAGLMRQKFKYESLQRRRAYRSGEWQPPENGATQRW